MDDFAPLLFLKLKKICIEICIIKLKKGRIKVCNSFLFLGVTHFYSCRLFVEDEANVFLALVSPPVVTFLE